MYFNKDAVNSEKTTYFEMPVNEEIQPKHTFVCVCVCVCVCVGLVIYNFSSTRMYFIHV